MRTAFILVSTLLFTSGLASEGQEDGNQEHFEEAKKLLESAADKMRNSDEIAFEIEDHRFKKPVPATYWIRKPNKLRIQWSLPNDHSMLMLCDGSRAWTYRTWDNRYTRVEQPPGPPIVLSVKDPITSLFLSESVTEVLTGVTIEKVEEATRGDTSCSLITWNIRKVARGRIWIDDDSRICRYGHEQGATKESCVLKNINLKPDLAEDAFSFVPPKEAKLEVAPTKGKLLPNGTLAPSFQATGLDGKTVKLSDFKGKTVLLNFWAYV
jgi:outer membrane lipoprotein-sorting protein